MRVVVFAALACAMIAGPADAKVRMDLKYRSYSVRGLSVQAIWRDIGRKGPHQLERGLYAQAEARISYDWKVAYQQRGPTCGVKSGDVALDVRILLPGWADEKRGSKALRASWKRYAAKVRAHEDTHKAIALKAANKIDRLLQGASIKGSCQALERDLKRKATLILAQERKQQEYFDRNDPPIYLR